MADDIAISVENVSKAYRIWNDPAARLKSPFCDGLAGFLPAKGPGHAKLKAKAESYYRDFYALKDVSFQVRKGESVGIIGRNGSGKSTLLQIIAGTLRPTIGSVRVNGRVAALLELGSGFNPEFTGRENVYLNAAVLGLTCAEAEAKFDSIAAFADIGDFLDQPVKTYSSGMMVRLAFAVAVATNPDVLIIDEALSVGDVFFQQKSFKRIRQILQNGASLLLVSHDLGAIQNLCHSAILLDDGKSTYAGPPEECTSRYYARHRPRSDQSPILSPRRSTRQLTAESVQPIVADNILGRARSRHGNRALELLAARLAPPNSEAGMLCVEMGGQLRLDVWVRANQFIASPACGIHLFDRMNNLVFGAGTPQLHISTRSMVAGDEALFTITIRFDVQPGPYTFNISLAEPDPENPNLGLFHDVSEGLGPIEITAPPTGVWAFYGIAKLPMEIEVSYA